MEPLLKPLLRPLVVRKQAIALILFSITTEEGQPLLTEEGGLIQTEQS